MYIMYHVLKSQLIVKLIKGKSGSFVMSGNPVLFQDDSAHIHITECFDEDENYDMIRLWWSHISVLIYQYTLVNTQQA